MLTNLIYHL